jgi:AcrR family transcriptional regulator
VSDRSERSERRNQRRDELLEAALGVIRRQGRAASMEAMAAAAKITKPILYRYFGDREGLFSAVADRFAGELIERIEAALAATGSPPRDRLVKAIDSYVGFIEDDPELYGFVMEARMTLLLGVADRIAVPIARAIGEELRQAGADSGPAEAWAYGIVGMVHLAGAHWATNPTLPRARLVEYLTELVWAGMPGFAGIDR